MKAKANIPKKSKPRERPRLVRFEDERSYPPYNFHLLKEIKPFLGVGAAPSAKDCEDLSLVAYLRAHAIADFIEFAEAGLDAQGSKFSRQDSPLPWIVEALQLARLAAETLYLLYEETERRDVQPQKSA
jgi:hypothetical protein